MNKITQEDRNIIILIIIFLLILSVYFIYVLLNNEDIVEGNIEVNKNYEEINSTDKFKLYKFIGNEEYNFNIRNNNIKYLNNELSINGTYIDSNVKIVNYISFYNYNMILLITSTVVDQDYILILNTFDNTYNILDKIDDMYIDNIYDITVSEAGIALDLTSLIDNKISINKELINPCDYNKDYIISKNIIYFYDYDSNEFNDSEELDKVNLKEYKKNMC